MDRKAQRRARPWHSRPSRPGFKPTVPRRPGLRRFGWWAGGVTLAIALLLVGVLSISDWNFARERISSFASNRLHREVTIAGPLTAKLLSSHPRVHIGGLSIRNPDWAGDGNVA